MAKVKPLKKSAKTSKTNNQPRQKTQQPDTNQETSLEHVIYQAIKQILASKPQDDQFFTYFQVLKSELLAEVIDLDEKENQAEVREKIKDFILKGVFQNQKKRKANNLNGQLYIAKEWHFYQGEQLDQTIEEMGGQLGNVTIDQDEDRLESDNDDEKENDDPMKDQSEENSAEQGPSKPIGRKGRGRPKTKRMAEITMANVTTSKRNEKKAVDLDSIPVEKNQSERDTLQLIDTDVEKQPPVPTKRKMSKKVQLPTPEPEEDEFDLEDPLATSTKNPHSEATIVLGQTFTKEDKESGAISNSEPESGEIVPFHPPTPPKKKASKKTTLTKSKAKKRRSVTLLNSAKKVRATSRVKKNLAEEKKQQESEPSDKKATTGLRTRKPRKVNLK